MEYSRLIHDYLEGELPLILEDKLFSAMALNQDLRYELNRQIKIHLITKNDMNSITIPSEATNAVFSGLGFSIPSSSSTSMFYKFKQDFSIKKYSRYLISFSAIVIIGLLLYYTSDNSFTGINNQTPITSLTAGKSNIQPASVLGSNTNSDSKSINNEKPSKINEKTHNNTKPVFSLNNVESSNNVLPNEGDSSEKFVTTSENNEENYSEINTLQMQRIAPSSFYERNSPVNVLSGNLMLNQNGLSANSFYNLFTPSTTKPFGIDITWHKANYQIERPSTLAEDDKTFFLGNNFSIMYNFDENHAIGFEMGEETFAQEFDYFNGEQMTTYNQTPNYYWFAAAYKYTADIELIQGLRPYAKLIAGGAKGGAIVKSQLGLTWNFSPGFSFNLGGEFGTMIYNINKDLYHSDKFSIMYGLTMHL